MIRDAARSGFEKWEGLGNDFVLVPRATIAVEDVRALCDRRRGVGADGVLLLDGADTDHPRMTVYNADGSRPEMCGNGLRCVAAYLVARGQGPLGREMVIATDAGDRRCVVGAGERGLYDVEVGMGSARIAGELDVREGDREHRFRVVDVGNPHAITFDPYEAGEVDRVGPKASAAPPSGYNVEFCRVADGAGGAAPRIDVVVWERGVGRTLACGTGACAVAALACDTGRAHFDRPVRVVLPGGELEVTVRKGTFELSMKGPARHVFTGEVALS